MSLKSKLKGIDLTTRFDNLVKYRVPTGIIAVDRALSGGIPSGRLTEVSGGWSTGKSLLSLLIAVEALKMGGLVVYVDAEFSLDRGLAELVQLDVNHENFIYPELTEETTITDVFELLEKFIILGREQSPDSLMVFIIDSIAAMRSEKELKEAIGERTAALWRAKLITDAMGKYMPRIHRSNICLICVNQFRDRIDVQFGEKQSTPGGRAVKFHASIRIKLNRMGAIKDKLSKEVVINKVRMTNIKSKVGIPYRYVDFEIPIMESIDPYSGLLDYLIRHGQIEHKDKSKKYKFTGTENEFEKKDFIERYKKWDTGTD